MIARACMAPSANVFKRPHASGKDLLEMIRNLGGKRCGLPAEYKPPHTEARCEEHARGLVQALQDPATVINIFRRAAGLPLAVDPSKSVDEILATWRIQ